MELDPAKYGEWRQAWLTVREPGRWASSLSAAVRDARPASGRDVSTGAVADPARAGSWLGAVGYLIAIDLIGTCFRRIDAAPFGTSHKTGASRRAPEFELALAHFGPADLRQDEPRIRALYALRCSLVHNYALTNVPENDDPRLRHAFLLGDEGIGELVTLPPVAWDGNVHSGHIYQTTIDLRLLGDAAELTVANLTEAHAAGETTLVLEGGTDELLNRFTLTFYG